MARVAEDRICPGCGNETIVSSREADAVYSTGDWGVPKDIINTASKVCSFCHAVKIDGSWERIESVAERAYELSQSSGSKNTSDYKKLLTAGTGIQAHRTTKTADNADNW